MGWALLIVACVLALACATPYPPTPDYVAWVQVENGHWLEHTVYANCGIRVRLGQALPVDPTVLRIPHWCVGREITFVVDPIGSRELSASDPISVAPGDTLKLAIPAVTNGYLFVSRVP